MTTTPHPIDILVGRKVRAIRTLKGMSQERLGDALKITFQQVQKYEKGTNRISASKLWEIAEALDVEIKVFFEEASGGGGDEVKSLVGISAEAYKLGHKFDRVPTGQRAPIVGLVDSLAKLGEDELNDNNVKGGANAVASSR